MLLKYTSMFVLFASTSVCPDGSPQTSALRTMQKYYQFCYLTKREDNSMQTSWVSQQSNTWKSKMFRSFEASALIVVLLHPYNRTLSSLMMVCKSRASWDIYVSFSYPHKMERLSKAYKHNDWLKETFWISSFLRRFTAIVLKWL